MMERIKEVWEGLDMGAVVNKRELFLEFLVCARAGILLGILISPKKRVMVGCYNGGCVAEELEQDEIE